jgi:hypothetical protein
VFVGLGKIQLLACAGYSPVRYVTPSLKARNTLYLVAKGYIISVVVYRE